jgi:DNA polymerase
VYIANVIKCRPPQNRNPDPDEVETCEPFLFQQIDAIKPKVIVALGKFARTDAAPHPGSDLASARPGLHLRGAK